MDRHLLAVPVLALALVAGVPAHAAPVAAKAAVAKPAPVPRMVLPFVHDDWDKAVALAKARKTPVFIEAWAPW